MNTHRIHMQLSAAIRDASRIRDQLNSPDLSFARRWTCRLRYVCLLARVRNLTEQLRIAS
jgi:hypothetical protein